jgi:hypothetical protein
VVTKARLFQLSGLFALSVGCSQVLGIEDAHVDSALLGGPAGAANQGGSPAVTAGTANAAGGESPGHEHGVGGLSGSSASDGGKAGSAVVAASGADTGEGGTPPVTSICESYCDAVMTNCKGKYEQYRTFGQCVEVCKRLPEGQSGDEDVNSVQCRVRQAQFAESEPFLYCKSAGPLGAGRCGSNCLAYCSLMQTTCTPESTENNLELSYFADTQACLADCGAIPTHEDDPLQYSSSATATPSCFVGNTLYCRIYHVAAALEQDTPDEHCPHAMGGDPCKDP